MVREFVGHGIGRALHEEPQVPNYGPKGKVALKVGMVLAIEPMINAGSHEVKVLSDGWTAVTVDRSLSAHFEHTVAITPQGPEILTVNGQCAGPRKGRVKNGGKKEEKIRFTLAMTDVPPRCILGR